MMKGTATSCQISRLPSVYPLKEGLHDGRNQDNADHGLNCGNQQVCHCRHLAFFGAKCACKLVAVPNEL